MNFVESKNIKFYPTGYRGNITIGNDNYSFDPESKLNTEENTRRAYNTLVTFKDVNQNKHDGDVVISKDYTYTEPPQQGNYQFHNFEFIISGYYVKILDADKAFFNIIKTNASGKSIYAEIKIVNRGFDEQKEKNETNPILDENNTAIICRSVISLKPANTSGQSQSTTDDSTEGNENSNLDIDGEFTGINFIINDSNHIDETTITDKNIHIFKILEKVNDKWKVPTSAKLMISLDDIYGNIDDTSSKPLTASEAMATNLLSSYNIVNDNNINTDSLTTNNINNLKLEVTKAATHTNGLNMETLGETNQEKVFLNVHYDKTTDQDPRRGFTLKESSNGNSVNIISVNESNSNHDITFNGNSHTFAAGEYNSVKKSGEEYITVAGNKFDVVTRDSNQWLNSDKRWIHNLESADKHFLQISYDNFNTVPNGYGIQIWDNMGGTFGQYGDTTSGISHYIQSSSHLNKKGYTLDSVHRKWKNYSAPDTPTTHEPLVRWYNEIGILDPTEGTNFLSDDNNVTKTQMYVAYKVSDGGSTYKLKERAIITPESLSIENVNNNSTNKNFIAYLKNTTDDTYPKIGVSQAVNNTFDDVIYLSPNGIRMKYTASTSTSTTVGFNPRSNEEIIATTYVNKIESNTDSAANVGLNAKYFKANNISPSDTGLETKGKVQAYSFYATSDRRLKDHIEPIDYNKSILDLPVYTYTYKDSDKKQIGCMAQDLQKLYPELVSQDENGYLSVDNSKVVYLLLEEVKLLKKEIEDLKKSK